jgi:hypothetical protein
LDGFDDQTHGFTVGYYLPRLTALGKSIADAGAPIWPGEGTSKTSWL